MGQPDDFPDVRDRADRVGCPADRDDARTRGEGSLHIVHVQRAALDVNIHRPHNRPFLLQRQPWGDIGVMIETCNHDLISVPNLSTDRAAHCKGEGRHVPTEDHLIGVASQQIRNPGMGRPVHVVGPPAGDKCAMCVRIGMNEVVGHGIHHSLRHLSAAGRIHEYGRPAVHHFGQRRKLGANPTKMRQQAGRFEAHHTVTLSITCPHTGDSIAGGASCRADRRLR